MSIIPNINNEALQLLPDIALWKQQIADSINERGGNANPNSAFTQLAQDIEDIPNFPTTGFEYISEIYRPRTLMEAYNRRIYLKSIVNNTIEEIRGSYAFSNCTYLQSVQWSNLAKISGSGTFSSCSSLQSVQWPNLSVISGNDTFSNCFSLQSVQWPNLSVISGGGTFSSCSSLQSVQWPNLSVISGNYTFFNCSSLQSVQFGSLSRCVDPFQNPKSNLRNITIQDANINLPFQNWTATNIINEGQSGIDELNSNLYNNLLTKLYDHSNDGETRILQIGWLDYITPENIAYANAKGWTITN